LNVFVDFEQLKEEYEEFRKRLNNYWKERSTSCMNEILTQEKSIYLQIAEMIETDILRDILLEEERVPSTNELAKLYAINPATAAKGVNILVDEGVLYKKRGIGMFVSAGAKEAILSRRKNEFYDNYVKKLLEEAASIGLGKEEVIQLIQSGNEA
jgi:DNA-binding transcriptional regulator YhcF (GntR family)